MTRICNAGDTNLAERAKRLTQATIQCLRAMLINDMIEPAEDSFLKSTGANIDASCNCILYGSNVLVYMDTST